MDKSMEEKTIEKKCYITEKFLEFQREARRRSHEHEIYMVNELLAEKSEKEAYLRQMTADNEQNFEPPKENEYSDPVFQARYEEWWNLAQKAIAANKRMQPLRKKYRENRFREHSLERKQREESQYMENAHKKYSEIE